MKKRTKKAYGELYNNPKRLFPEADVILFPNGRNEMWIKGKQGGFRITAGEGPAGFSITVSPFTGDNEVTGLAMVGTNYASSNIQNVKEMVLIQYNQDEKSQAFREWYMADSIDLANKEELRKKYEELKENGN